MGTLLGEISGAVSTLDTHRFHDTEPSVRDPPTQWAVESKVKQTSNESRAESNANASDSIPECSLTTVFIITAL